jgi:hypothetical protein
MRERELSPIHRRNPACYECANGLRFASEWIAMPAIRELHPTGLIRESLAAQVLDFMYRGNLGLPALAAAADVVAAECRNNMWFANDVKGARISDEQVIRLLEGLEANADRCCVAMAAFAAGGSYEQLCSELAAVATYLNNRSL